MGCGEALSTDVIKDAVSRLDRAEHAEF